MEKLAIVASGGGMNCSYSAGVLYALEQYYQLKYPVILIGVSGSAGNLAYFLTEQMRVTPI